VAVIRGSLAQKSDRGAHDARARGTRPVLQGTSGTAYAGRGGDMGRRWGGGSLAGAQSVSR
jgi:hypothetical protein